MRAPRTAQVAALAAVLAMLAAVRPAGTNQSRDRSVDPADRALIAGIVTTDSTPPAPLRRAVVTVAGGGVPGNRQAITGDDGRFVIDGLPAGRYTVTASKPAYLTSAYGARRPGRTGTALVLTDGERVDVDIRLARGAVIEGVVRDEDGQPIPGIEVSALNARRPGQVGLRFGAALDVATTDDLGRYRIFGLAPGEYVIAASVTPAGEGEIGRRREADVDALIEMARRGASSPGARVTTPARAPAVGYPVTYHPGVPAFAAAARIDLAAGDERLGVDVALAPVATSSVEGVVQRTDGLAASAVTLSLYADGPRVFRAGTAPMLVQPPDASGRFRYTGLVPGRYTLFARAQRDAPADAVAVAPGGVPPPPAPPRPVSSDDIVDVPLFAVAEFDVTGQDLSGLSLVLQPGATLSGRVVFDAASASPPPPVSGLIVRVGLPGGTYTSIVAGTTLGTGIVSRPPVSVGRGGGIAVRGLAPGRYTFGGTVPAEIAKTWWLRSAMLDGRDLLDVPIDIGTRDVDGLVLTLTDRRTELAGSLEAASGLPAPEYFIVVFPADRALWQAGSRRIRSTRPDTSGAFSLRDLPPGAYLIAALTDLEPADLADERFLDEMARQAVAVEIVDGHRTVQGLRIGG